MLTAENYNRLKSLADEVSRREGCKLYDLDFVGRMNNRTLRVYIQALENGVGIDQCANVSRGLSLLLDVEDLIPGGQYDLEVSSPGLDRPLKEKWHYEEALGEEVVVKTKEDISQDKKRKVKQARGQLVSVDEGSLKLESESSTWEIELNNIHKAHVVFQHEVKSKDLHKNKRGKK